MTTPPLKKPLPIGKYDYKKVIDGNYTYIDKTLLIKEFCESGSEVVLITRPRRFGKSIALSMLRYFFEKTEESTAYLFENSAIWKEQGFKELQGTYPVIHISFKDIKATTWDEAYLELQELLIEETKRTLKTLFPLMDEDGKEQYQSLIKKKANTAEFSGSLFFITKMFKECLNKQTIILIDEYDSPITTAYIHNYYTPMITFMSQLLSKALKGNIHLERGLMTGVVRTAKDGILSGLNNLDIYTMLEAGYSDKFGFTQNETEELLLKAGRLDKKEEVRSWYNGYVIGAEYLSDPKTAHYSTKVYNPWSVLSYLKGAVSPKPYWVNTGSLGILERLIAESGEETQRDLQILLENNELENKQINQDVILLDLDKKHIEPWSFLLFAGYLTATKHCFQNDENYYTLAIPNKEIAKLYKNLVTTVIHRAFAPNKLQKLLEGLIAGKVDEVNSLLSEFINSLCSSHDLPQNDKERSLHMFVLGLLSSLSERYTIKSNLESGLGRFDIIMLPKKNDLAVVIELKKGKSLQELDSLSSQALQQIQEKKYLSLIRDFNYSGKVLCYGIAIFKKHLIAKME